MGKCKPQSIDDAVAIHTATVLCDKALLAGLVFAHLAHLHRLGAGA